MVMMLLTYVNALFILFHASTLTISQTRSNDKNICLDGLTKLWKRWKLHCFGTEFGARRVPMLGVLSMMKNTSYIIIRWVV